MRPFLHPNGFYFEAIGDGDVPAGAVSVPKRPDPDHDFKGGRWQLNATRKAEREAAEKQAKDRDTAARRARAKLVARAGLTPDEIDALGWSE